MARDRTLSWFRDKFKKELSVYGFKQIANLDEVNIVLRYSDPDRDLSVEIICVAAFTAARVQRGENIEFTRFWGYEEALAFIDSLLN